MKLLQRCLKTSPKKRPREKYREEINTSPITASIILNLGELGIPIKDSELFSIETYFEIVELKIKTLNEDSYSRRASQIDIDKFLL